MNKISHKKKIYATIFFIFALTEVLSWITLYILGQHNYSYARIYDPGNNIARYSGSCNDYMDTLELSPYLGFVHNKECMNESYRVNNLGQLNQDAEGPLDKKKYAIGIFGGSVAAQFAGLNTTPQIQELLNTCYTNSSNKEFAVYNFSDGAWKHPQQVIGLALFQDFLDAAISIEGFNEHEMIDSNVDFIFPAKSFFVLRDGIGIGGYIYRQLRLINYTPLRYFSSVKIFTFGFRVILGKLDNRKIQIEAKSYFQVDINKSVHNEIRYEGFVRSFEAIGKANNKYVLIVIQPVPINKILTIKEKEVVGKLDYAEKYQKIINTIEKVANNSLNLSNLFYKSDEEIFADPIHFINLGQFKSLGNYYIALNILDRMVKDNQIAPKENLQQCLLRHKPTLLIKKN